MSLDHLKVSLAPQNCFFWKHFDMGFDHEMWISKASRAVFPYLEYQVAGLNEETMYSMYIHFELTSKNCFQFENGRYLAFGRAAEHDTPKQVRHKEGVLSGKEWMKYGFSFRSVRISRDFKTMRESEIPLYLNQKYQPVISIREEPTPGKPNPPVIQCRLKHTEFITVSKIQLINKKGAAGRTALWKTSQTAPPTLATCTSENPAPVPTSPTSPTIELPRKRRLVDIEHEERNTNGNEEDVFPREDNTHPPCVVPNGSSIHQFRVAASQNNFFVPILLANQSFNFGLQQTPFPFPHASSHLSSLAGSPSRYMPNLMPQLPVVYLLFPFSMIPTLNHAITQPNRLGPFLYPFITYLSSSAQPFVYPPQQN